MVLSGKGGILRKSHVVLYSKVALLAVGVGLVIGIVLVSAPAQMGYEAENQVGDWVLSVRVTPTYITANDNITVEATMKYVGSENFSMGIPLSWINIIVTSTNRTICWEAYQPPFDNRARVLGGVNFEITPQFYVPDEEMIPPPPPGMYRVEVSTLPHWFNNSQITVAFPIEVEP
jgi:hypothetical protein